MRRGEVWWAEMPQPWGRRPVLLLSRDSVYDVLNAVLAAPLTTTVRSVLSQVRLDPRADGVPRLSSVNLNNIQPILKTALAQRITMLSGERMDEVDEAIHFALALRR